MKKWWHVFFFAAALAGTVSLRAQPAQQAEAETGTAMLAPHAGFWAGMLDQPMNQVVLVLGGLAAVLLVVLGIALFKRALRGGEQPGFENTYDGGYDTIQPTKPQRREPSLRPIALKPVADAKTDTVIAPWGVPADFDVPRFLRKSKAAFIRLQAAWDQADLTDIRRFTTRELFGEFCKQLKERGGAANLTEVVTLGAELQGVETVDEYYIATVKFTGMIKEEADAQPVPFAEVWNLSRPLDGHRSWVVAGIQQY